MKALGSIQAAASLHAALDDTCTAEKLELQKLVRTTPCISPSKQVCLLSTLRYPNAASDLHADILEVLLCAVVLAGRAILCGRELSACPCALELCAE